MVFGEKVNTFDESIKDLLNFENAAIEFIELLAAIGTAPPLYKYFPTKIYRRFVRALTRVHEYGTCVVILFFSASVCKSNEAVMPVLHNPTLSCFFLNCFLFFNKGSNILKEKYDKMVDAINSGVVDETKATCKTNF